MWYGGVSKETLELLTLGDQVIARVRQLVPYGAGNQKHDFQRTNQQSGYRTMLAQKTYGSDWARPMRNAAATIKFGSGNCQEQAAVAYLCLRESLPSTVMVAFCVAWKTKHSFATIGNPTGGDEEKVVVVDAWPVNAQAILWKHHFCRHDQQFQVMRCKPGVQGSGKTKIDTAKVKHYSGVNKDKELVMALFDAPPNPTWNHQWCATAKEMIQYDGNLLQI